MKTINNCQLEIDEVRGVIYVHGPHGWTLLRICGLPTPIPAPNPALENATKGMLDISYGHGVSWRQI